MAVDSGAGPSGLADQIFRVTRRLRQASGAATEPLGLSPHQVRALHVVGRCDGVRLSSLADWLRVAPRSATDVVDALEGKGLLARSADPSDRRATLVQLTAEGREVLAHADRLRGVVHRELFAALTPAEAATLAELLAKLDEPRPTT